MKKISKYNQNIDALRTSLRTATTNKYYNLFLNSYRILGLTEPERLFIFKRFWDLGTCAAFPIAMTDLVGFTTYTTKQYNIYDFPEVIELRNKRNVPYIPKTPQIVGLNAAVGFILPNQKPIAVTLQPYIDKLVNIQMVMNTNAQLQKLPYVIGVTQADRQKAEDLLNQILSDKVAVFTDFSDLQNIKALVASAPYLLDKLEAHADNIENEIKTLLGIDNAPMTGSSKELNIDTVNASNAVININRLGLEHNIQVFLDDIYKVTGKTLILESVVEEVMSIYEETGNEVAGGDNGGTENNGRKEEENV